MVRAGQRLYEERLKKGLTIDEVARATKIRSSFLSAIERGEYNKLPSSAYIQGFVKNYAQFLGLPQKELLALFRREFSEKEFLRVLPQGLAKKDEIPLGGFRFSQTALWVFVVFGVLGLYILFQYRYAIINPPLEVTTPKDEQIVSSELEVFGKTNPNATVFINDFSVSLNPDGTFSKHISLFSGKTTIRIRAVNRFGKQTEIQRHVEVRD